MDNKGPRKLLLINPANKVRKGFRQQQSTRFMPLGLGIVAALTPPHWEVELLDENFEEFTLKPADLVALTSFTSTATRAYEIATLCREAGIHTVMGGIHASMCVEEALAYVDTVVTGEAEGAWPTLINDFESGTTKRLYEGGLTEIKDIPHVRREIYRYPYSLDLVQTSRGCPSGCEFCSVTRMCGKNYREREVEDVLDELEKTTRPMLFFVDDNLVNNKKGADERAIRLFKGMVERKIKKQWLSQASLNFTDNDDVLYWARKSGCMVILMGIEAETPHALQGVRKNMNLKRGVNSYKTTFRKMHKHGIGVLAAMIFGMDSDTKEDLYARSEFIKSSAVDSYQCTILTPLPGTVLYDRLMAQNRIILKNYPADWQHYHFMAVTTSSLLMSSAEFESTMYGIWFDLYDKGTMRRKMFRTLWNTRSFTTAYWHYSTNHNYAGICLEEASVHHSDVNSGTAWKNTLRFFYLKFTDVIIWLLYHLVWTKMIKRLSPR